MSTRTDIRIRRKTVVAGTITTKSVQKFVGRDVRGVFKNDELLREVKSFPTTVKQVGDRTIEGLFSVFGYVDDTLDVIHPGAFAKTIQESSRRFKHLWQHDFGMPPIATVEQVWEVRRDELPSEVLDWTNGTATGGAMVRRTYLKNNEMSNWVYEALMEKALTEMSFAFDTIKWEYEKNDDYPWPLRHIKELAHYESSDVLWGANDATISDLDARGLTGNESCGEMTDEKVFEIFEQISSGKYKMETEFFESKKDVILLAAETISKMSRAEEPPAEPATNENSEKEAENSLDTPVLSLDTMQMRMRQFEFETEI